jgi:sigma-B regulation protein RsbU (phosphoserine phosphatase)
MQMLAGRHRILRQIGRGGMGAVALAEDTWRDGRRIALKHAPIDDVAARTALEREYDLLRRLSHPFVVSVGEFGTCRATGTAFFTMEHVDGVTLREVASRSLPERVRLMAQVARGLEFVHSRGVAHGDVKEDNVLVLGEAGEARACLLDFGLAAEAGDAARKGFSGTLTHAAPELLGGGVPDVRSDLYALGVTAHSVLAGEPPFSEADPLALAAAHRSREPASLRGHAELPRAVQDVVMQMLAKDPAARPASAAALADALEKAWPSQAAESLASRVAWARSPRLVGAAEAERAAADLLERCRSPRAAGPRMLLASGQSGAGVSRLLAELAGRAPLRGVLVLAGVAAPEPLSALAGPLRDAMRHLGDGAEVIERRASLLARVLPELAARAHDAPPAAPSREEELLRVGDALWDVMEALAARPALIVIEHLEEADEDSLVVLGHLGRRLALEAERGKGLPLCIAAGIRHDGAEAASLAVVPAQRVVLRPVRGEALAHVVGAMFPTLDHPARLAGLIESEGGGGAALAERWCAALVRRDALVKLAGRWRANLEDPVARQPPPGEAEQVASDVAALPGPARTALLQLALVGRPIPPEALREAAGALPPAFGAMVGELERRRLVRVEAREQGPMLQPASRLVAEAALGADAASVQDAARHLLAVASLGPLLTAAERASLAERAGRPGEAIPLLREAIRAAAAIADNDRAARHAQHLARLLPRGVERRDVLREASRFRVAGERLDEAEALAREAATGGEIPEELARQLALEGTLEHRRGRLDAASERLQAACAAWAAAGQEPPFEVEMDLARVLSAAREAEADGLLARLAARCPEAERPALLLLQGSQALRARNDARAVALFEAGVLAARRAARPLVEASCANNLGVAATRAGDVAAARRHLRRAVALRRAAGIRGGVAGALTNLSNLEAQVGRHAEAARHARACVEVQQELGNARGEMLGWTNLLVALVAREDVAGARSALTHARALLERLADPEVETLLLLNECELELVAGTHAMPCPRHDEALALAHRTGNAAATCGAMLLDLAARPESEQVPRARALLRDPPALAEDVGMALLRTAASSALTRSRRRWLHSWEATPVSEADATLALEAARSAAAVLARGERYQIPMAALAAASAHVALADTTDAAVAAASAELTAVSADLLKLAPPLLRLEWSAALAACDSWRGDPQSAEARLGTAIEALRHQARRVPAAAREGWLSHPLRRGVREALLHVREGRLLALREAPFFAVVDSRPAAPASTGDPEAGMRRAVVRVERTVKRLRDALEISRGISTLLPLEELLARILESAMKFMDADRGFIVLGSGTELRFAASRDRSGRPVPRAEFALSTSVLEEVMRTRQGVLSSDARADARFVSKASVMALDLRSVLVAPLVASTTVIGALYLDNLQASGVFDDEDQEVLALLAAQAAVAVANARLHAERVEAERVQQELAVASAIQQALLPRQLPTGSGFRLAAVMEPARALGGDYYDAFATPDGRVRLVVGDVSGKGVPAGLFMVMARTILRSVAQVAGPLDRILAEANALIESQVEDDRFLTLILLEPQGDGRVVRYCLAGHEPPMLFRRAGGRAASLAPGGLALGMLPDIASRLEQREVRLEPGDVLACYTDGVTEAMDPSGKMFGRERLRVSLERHAGLGVEGLLHALLEDLAGFRAGAERNDDVTLVLLEPGD